MQYIQACIFYIRPFRWPAWSWNSASRVSTLSEAPIDAFGLCRPVGAATSPLAQTLTWSPLPHSHLQHRVLSSISRRRTLIQPPFYICLAYHSATTIAVRKRVSDTKPWTSALRIKTSFPPRLSSSSVVEVLIPLPAFFVVFAFVFIFIFICWLLVLVVLCSWQF